MRRHPAAEVAAGVLVAIDLGVIVAPGLVLAGAAAKGGLARTDGLDLVVASTVIGAVHAKVVWDRLRDEVAHAGRVVDVWIAAFDSLVVLALGATLLLLLVLGGFAEQHAALLNRGWPVLGLWVAVQLAAVGLAEISGRLVFRWLEPRRDPTAPPRPGGRRASDRAAPPVVAEELPAER